MQTGVHFKSVSSMQSVPQFWFDECLPVFEGVGKSVYTSCSDLVSNCGKLEINAHALKMWHCFISSHRDMEFGFICPVMY